RCGAAGAPCCAGNVCSDGSCCVAVQNSFTPGACVAQGSNCSSLSTAPAACMAGGSCGGTCGAVGQPCCTNSSSTTRWCGQSGTTCLLSGASYVCARCGGQGQPC